MEKRLWDPISGLTHLGGMIFSIVGLILLVLYALSLGTTWHIISYSIFGGSLILLYAASSLYHLLPLKEKGKNLLRKIDHMMIYVLIAGTYTPICLIPLRGAWGWSILGIIWGCVILGFILKIGFNPKRYLSTILYLIMGWLVIIAFYPLIKNIPIQGIIWLIIGGIFYSLGAIIYALKWPLKNNKYFGFHELFHLFVLGGSIAHFWLMFHYILYI